MLKKKRIKFCLQLIVILTLIYAVLYYFLSSKNGVIEKQRVKARNFSLYECPSNENFDTIINRNYAYNLKWQNETNLRVLLIKRQESIYAKTLATFIHYLKIPVRSEVFDVSELLLDLKEGRFSIIIFEDYNIYLNLDSKNKQILMDYCSKNKVGIISFFGFGGDNLAFEKETHVKFVSDEVITDLHFTNDSKIPFVAKKNRKLSLSQKDGSGWSVFYPQSMSSYHPFITCVDSGGIDAAVAIHDNGSISHVEHIIFGQNLQHFFIKLAFWDALLYMSRGSYMWSLDTYIQIDIDDVFVGQVGTRLVSEDISALIDSQNFLRNHIEQFNYTLGFSGHFFRRGDKVENEADEILVGWF
uniref:Heparan sulphate-N-deacetylase domain-containing protein n=1 Tax=Panagrolaimus superbus TaxID=310955 RepID=A0A914YAX4_9BILA